MARYSPFPSMDHCGTRPATGAAGGHSGVDFANTIACPGCRAGDALESEASAHRWLRAHPDLPALSNGSLNLAELRRLRGSVRDLLYATIRRTRPGLRSLATVNTAAAGGLSWSTLEWRRGQWQIIARIRPGNGTGPLAGTLARSVVALLGGPGRKKLRACQGPGCVHLLFVRTRQQLWCSPTGCGNRVRVARHWRKVRARSARNASQTAR